MRAKLYLMYRKRKLKELRSLEKEKTEVTAKVKEIKASLCKWDTALILE